MAKGWLILGGMGFVNASRGCRELRAVNITPTPYPTEGNCTAGRYNSHKTYKYLNSSLLVAVRRTHVYVGQITVP